MKGGKFLRCLLLKGGAEDAVLHRGDVCKLVNCSKV
jgi:hypothetical protein